MDLSLLLLTTPMIPPTPPVNGVPRPATGPLVTGAVARPAVAWPGPDCWPPVTGPLLRPPIVGGPLSRPPVVEGPLSRPPGPVWRCPPAVAAPPPGRAEIPAVPC